MLAEGYDSTQDRPQALHLPEEFGDVDRLDLGGDGGGGEVSEREVLGGRGQG